MVPAMSPALFSFTLGNPSPDRKPFRFELDTYPLSGPADLPGHCAAGRVSGASHNDDRQYPFARHKRVAGRLDAGVRSARSGGAGQRGGRDQR